MVWEIDKPTPTIQGPIIEPHQMIHSGFGSSVNCVDNIADVVIRLGATIRPGICRGYSTGYYSGKP